MHYADDLNPLPIRSVDHQMRSAGMDTYRRCKLTALPGHLWKVSEQVEECKQAIRIMIGLLYTPFVCAIVLDVGQISFSGGSNDPTAIFWHIQRASYGATSKRFAIVKP